MIIVRCDTQNYEVFQNTKNVKEKKKKKKNYLEWSWLCIDIQKWVFLSISF